VLVGVSSEGEIDIFDWGVGKRSRFETGWSGTLVFVWVVAIAREIKRTKERAARPKISFFFFENLGLEEMDSSVLGVMTGGLLSMV